MISQVSSTDTEETAQIVQGLSAFLLGLIMLNNSNTHNHSPNASIVETLKDTIRKRIGVEQFEEKLEFISQHDAYSKTLKKTTTSLLFSSSKKNNTNSSANNNSSSLLFDYEFTRLFKSNEGLILNLFKSDSGSKNSKHIVEESNQLIEEKYKAIISQQDSRLREQLNLNQTLQFNFNQMQDYCNQLISEINNLKASGQNSPHFSSTEKLKMQARINELEVKCNLLEEK